MVCNKNKSHKAACLVFLLIQHTLLCVLTMSIHIQFEGCSDVRASEESLKAAPALAVIAELPGDSMERDRDELGLQDRIMAAPLGRDALPEHWSYGVCGDGRVFFIK